MFGLGGNHLYTFLLPSKSNLELRLTLVEGLTLEPVGPGPDAACGLRAHPEVVGGAGLQRVDGHTGLQQVTVQMVSPRHVVVHLHLVLPALPSTRTCSRRQLLKEICFYPGSLLQLGICGMDNLLTLSLFVVGFFSDVFPYNFCCLRASTVGMVGHILSLQCK